MIVNKVFKPTLQTTFLQVFSASWFYITTTIFDWEIRNLYREFVDSTSLCPSTREIKLPKPYNKPYHGAHHHLYTYLGMPFELATSQLGLCHEANLTYMTIPALTKLGRPTSLPSMMSSYSNPSTPTLLPHSPHLFIHLSSHCPLPNPNQARWWHTLAESKGQGHGVKDQWTTSMMPQKKALSVNSFHWILGYKSIWDLGFCLFDWFGAMVMLLICLGILFDLK